MATAGPSLSSTLPIRLQNFFARYPPNLYSAKYTGVTIPLTRKDAKEAAAARHAEIQKTRTDAAAAPSEKTPWTWTQPILLRRTENEASLRGSSETVTVAEGTTIASDAAPSESLPTEETLPTTTSTSSSLLPPPQFPPNPFLPLKRNNHWRGPAISLRRQSDLVKLARQYSIEDLLPPGRKSSAFKEARLLERGLRIKGVGEGQKVKGHKWERQMEMNLDKRRRAMEGMPGLVREWRQKGHGRGWTKFPSSKGPKAM